MTARKTIIGAAFGICLYAGPAGAASIVHVGDPDHTQIMRPGNPFDVHDGHDKMELITPGSIDHGINFHPDPHHPEHPAPTDHVPAVPEPASWAMMIAGFGLIGGALRQRRNHAGLALR